MCLISGIDPFLAHIFFTTLELISNGKEAVLRALPPWYSSQCQCPLGSNSTLPWTYIRVIYSSTLATNIHPLTWLCFFLDIHIFDNLKLMSTYSTYLQCYYMTTGSISQLALEFRWWKELQFNMDCDIKISIGCVVLGLDSSYPVRLTQSSHMQCTCTSIPRVVDPSTYDYDMLQARCAACMQLEVLLLTQQISEQLSPLTFTCTPIL